MGIFVEYYEEMYNWIVKIDNNQKFNSVFIEIDNKYITVSENDNIKIFVPKEIRSLVDSVFEKDGYKPKKHNCTPNKTNKGYKR